MPNTNAITTKIIFNRIPTLVGEIKAQGEAHIQKTADNIVKGAQDRAPVRTGALRDSIHKEGSGNDTRVTVGVPYGVYVEYGTSRMGARPFLWPALEAERPIYLAAWRAILAGSGQRAGSATVTPGRGAIRRITGGRLPQ